MSEPDGITVILPHHTIWIPPESQLSWLTLFYALPMELVQKRPMYLDLPRTPYDILRTLDYEDLIMDDAFESFVLDCYAWAAWQYFQIPHRDGTYHEIPGDWSHYTGDFPLWRLSYHIIPYFRQKFEGPMDWSFQKLFLMPPGMAVPWLTYQQFGNLVGNLTDMIVEEQNWQPMIDAVWNARQVADYAGRNTHKRDFMRSWNHDRNHPHYSLEKLKESGIVIDKELIFDITDPHSQVEELVLAKIQTEDFFKTLDEKDRMILQMRMEGYTQQEIADKVGLKTTGAVSKRLSKLADKYTGSLEQYN